MMNESESTTSAASAGGLPWIHRRPRLHRNINRAVIGTLIAFAIGQVVLRTTDFLPMGRSLTAFVTYGMIVYVTIMGLLWLVFCSRFPRRAVWTVTTLVLVAIVGAASMIRGWSWTADSLLTFKWRWQPTGDERLEAFQKEQAASGASTSEVVVEPATPEDMPMYRGQQHEGVVTGPPLCEDWQASPPKVLWKHEVGGGYSQPVVVGKNLVTIEQRRDDEVVVLYDAPTGREIWSYSAPGKFQEALGGDGPRATPVIHDGKVYSLGALGHLACLDLATGKKVWSRELLADLGVPNQTWGITSSPLVHNDWLIVNVGGYYGGGLVAVTLADGKDVWKSPGIDAREGAPPGVAAKVLAESGDVPAADGEHAASSSAARNMAGYAAPTIVTLLGQPQILNYDGMGVWGHRIEDGSIIWFHHFQNGPAVNVAQPIIIGDDRVLISASYGMGSRLLQLSKEGESWSVKKLWQDLKSLESKMSSPALIDGYVYGFDEGFFACIDPETGKAKWKGSREVSSRGRYGHGQLLVTNGLILVLSEYGDLVLIRPNAEKLEELGLFHVLEGEKTWNPPALVNGIAYIRNHYEMAAVDLRGTPTDATPADSKP